MILSGLAFHRNGFGSVLWSATYLLMAACRSTMPTKGPRLRRRFGQHGEEAFNRVQSSGSGRREVEGDARVASEPGDHLGMFVGDIVG